MAANASNTHPFSFGARRLLIRTASYASESALYVENYEGVSLDEEMDITVSARRRIPVNQTTAVVRADYHFQLRSFTQIAKISALFMLPLIGLYLACTTFKEEGSAYLTDVDACQTEGDCLFTIT